VEAALRLEQEQRVKRKIYLIQPTYRDHNGRLLKERSLFVHSLALPALSAAIPPAWEKEFCLEHFEEVNYESDASVIGISCMVCDIFHACEIAETFRRRGKIVLIGGCAAPLWKSLVKPSVDGLVYGNPGPEGMRRLLVDVETGNVAPEYQFGTNIDYPFDYMVLAGKPISFMPVLGSVGCTNRCEFCCTAAMCNGQYHLRSLEAVMVDLRAVRRLTRRVAFVDSNLYNNREHLKDLCRRIIDENLDIIWGAECTLAVGEDPEVLGLLRLAGCRLLVIGIETVSQANLREMGKPNLVRRYPAQIKRIRDAGIWVGGFFIVGFDNDDPSTVEELTRFIREVHISLPFVNVLTPVPGTRLFERLKSEGRILMSNEADFLRQNLLYDTPMYRCYFLPKQMSPREAEQACLELRQKLCSLREIIRRSLVPDPFMAAALFLLNLRFRRETLAIARVLRKEAKPSSSTAPLI
jgi:radical SAM superfamily enzyme YgiQ (UPF0313 family)